MASSSDGDWALFQGLIDEVKGVVAWAAADGEFSYISSGFEDIWGISREQILHDNTRLLATIHPDDREPVKESIEAVIREDTLPYESHEFRIIRQDGSIRWVVARHTLVDPSVTDIDVVGLVTDITAQKEREERLRLLNRMIRHDIREDVAIIIGWADMLYDHADPDEKELLQHIITSARHIVDFTELSRDYVQTIVSDADLPVEPTPLKPTLESEIRLRKESFPEAEIIVDGNIPDATVRANKLLNSVFKNILNNAVEHTDAETPEIRIFCELHDGDAYIHIGDNGPGIPDDQKDVVFDKWQRGIGSDGTGVGLYLVKELVKQYGGGVWIEDNDPRGSVFIVRLPLHNQSG